MEAPNELFFCVSISEFVILLDPPLILSQIELSFPSSSTGKVSQVIREDIQISFAIMAISTVWLFSCRKFVPLDGVQIAIARTTHVDNSYCFLLLKLSSHGSVRGNH